MTLLKSPVFVICCLLFIIHQVFKAFTDQEITLVDSYLDSLVAMPIILTLLLVERIYLFKWENYKRLTLLEVVLATLFIALVSEVIFPLFSDDFTADWLDVICLFIGSFIFYFTINNTYKDNPERTEAT